MQARQIVDKVSFCSCSFIPGVKSNIWDTAHQPLKYQSSVQENWELYFTFQTGIPRLREDWGSDNSQGQMEGHRLVLVMFRILPQYVKVSIPDQLFSIMDVTDIGNRHSD